MACRCFITSPSFAPHLFLLGQLKLNLILLLDQLKLPQGDERWWVVPVISVDKYPFLAFSDLTCHLKDKETGAFLVALFCLIVRRPSLEVVTKRRLHQQVKILAQFQCHVMHGSVSLQLFLVVSIFLRSLGAISYNKSVFSNGHKNYFKDWCLMNSQLTFLFFTYFQLNEL